MSRRRPGDASNCSSCALDSVDERVSGCGIFNLYDPRLPFAAGRRRCTKSGSRCRGCPPGPLALMRAVEGAQPGALVTRSSACLGWGMSGSALFGTRGGSTGGSRTGAAPSPGRWSSGISLRDGDPLHLYCIGTALVLHGRGHRQSGPEIPAETPRLGARAPAPAQRAQVIGHIGEIGEHKGATAGGPSGRRQPTHR